MTARIPKLGAYVLASKYADGDPRDHFCLGFLSSILHFDSGPDRTRFIVVDNSGVPFRASGFRRAETVSTRTGDILFAIFQIIGDKPGHSVWWWRRHLKEAKELAATMEGKK